MRVRCASATGCSRQSSSRTSSARHGSPPRSATAAGRICCRSTTDASRPRLERHRGRVARVEGDGTLSTFDGPARAVGCATAIRDAVSPLGLEIRAGVHTGEVELTETGPEGIAVHIGARIAALAGAGEVLVSSTVKDLVVGAGLDFADRGAHELRGVPGEWRLFGVVG